MRLRRKREIFERHILIYYEDIYRYLVSLICDREVAGDLTQETMEKAWNNFDDLRSLESAKYWLLKIATNEFNRYYRMTHTKKRGFDKIHLEVDITNEELENITDDTLGPLEEIVLKGDRQAVAMALYNLDVEYRILINLHLNEELSFSDMAQLLNISLSTVKRRYRKSVELLKEEFLRLTEGGAESNVKG